MTKTKTEYPHDRFDDVELNVGRVGAHRAESRRRWWVPVVAVAGSSVVLIVAALATTSIIDARLNFEIPILGVTPTPTPTETVTPAITPADLTDEDLAALTITVLNGTITVGLADDAAGLLVGSGWPEATVANAAAESDLSAVIYGAVEDEGIARGIADALGIAEVQQSDMYPGARVTVLIGADFLSAAE